MCGAELTLCVATPSRGLVHSRTVAAVHKTLAGAPVRLAGWVLTHDLPIPGCHEHVCELALATGAELIWLVEEDVVPPANAVVVMLDAMREKAAVGAFVDYPIGHNPTWNCAQVAADGYVVWCGTGCLLLRREAFEALPRPWFDNRYEVEVRVRPEGVSVREFPRPYEYGGQDIGFTLGLWRRGVRIAYVPPAVAICQHLYLETWGQMGVNSGVHRVTPRRGPESGL
jgi:hypothetical protein